MRTPPLPPSGAAPDDAASSSGSPARRRPRQQRAQSTVDAIFAAVAQIVAAQGENGLTTNRIAEVAGLSVGSLYQYFPSKEAILLAMVSRFHEQVMRELDAILDDAATCALPLDARLRLYVRHYIHAFGGVAPEHRALVRLSWQLDYRDAMLNSVRGASERVAVHLHRMAGDAIRPPTPARMFVLTRAFLGVVRAASLENSPLLGSAELEDELVKMCIAIVSK